MKTLVTTLLLLVAIQLKVVAQCGPGTPTFTVNLTGNPSGTWNSPFVIRNDNCCGTNAPDRCVKFVITLDPAAVGVNFNIIDGAVPGGALFYQINCGPPSALGSPICLSGPGPHILTFCKPGNNDNVYQVSSIPGPTAGTNVTINDGCIGSITASGYNPATVTWSSIFPGTPGQYNSYLSCTSGCVNPTVQAGASPPAFVDYKVCGQPAALCNNGTTCDTVRVTFNPTLGVTIAPQNPTICFGQTSTSLTATGTGGTPPYSYLWNNVNSAQTINVGVGTYNVQLSDASGCPPTFSSVTVTQFSVAIDANAGPDQTKCIQSPVTTLNATVAGASGGVWSGGAGSFSPSNTTLTNMVYTPTAAEVSAGSVNLILTTTGNGTCPPDRDTVKISFQPFSGTPTVVPTDVSCSGGTNGSATASVTGGTSSPYTFSWNTVPAQTGATASNLAPGTYTVSITSAIGCVVQASVTINQPPPVTLASTVTNVSCNTGTNGSIAITASGGTPGYTYLWSPGGQTTATATNLAAGVYTVTVWDSKNCTATGTYTVTQPLPLTASVTGTNVNCSGGSNGTASSTVSGGTIPYTYSWSPGGSTAANVTGLTAGNYTLTVTDNKSCVVTATVAITQPTPLLVSTTQTNETCDYLNNGTATAVVSGGTTSYTYLWQPGGQTTSSISSLANGTYTLTVTDARGCIGTAFATITQPTPLAATFINQTNVACFAGTNGSVTASASGGTPNYTYSWMPGAMSGAAASNLAAGTYTVTVTDNNTCQVQNTVTITQPAAALAVSGVVTNVSCNAGSNGNIATTVTGGTSSYTYLWSPTAQTGATAVSLAAGTYTVNVTDAHGCTTSGTYTVTQPAVLTATLTPSSVSCFGGTNGSVTSSVSGGTIPYTYNWTPGNLSTPDITNLAAGTYSVTITDSKGCVINNSATVTQPTVLFVATSPVNETCSYLNNGSATATVTGGTINYTYSWLPGGQTTATASALASGTYTVTVTDSRGCVASSTTTITEPVVLTATFGSQMNVSCFGGANGSVTAIASGGTPNYTYTWAPGAMSGATASGLAAGTYTVTVTDNNTCQVQNTVTITQPVQALSVSPSSTPASCFGSANGTVSASAIGGTIPYASYVWQPGGTSGTIVNGLVAGNYTVTATDANGCTATNTITVTQPAAIVPVTSTVNSTCNQSNGEASVSVTGGVPPYTYVWSPSGGTSTTATGLVSGPYSVLVTDDNGCSIAQFANVNDIGGPQASIFSTTDVSCFGGSDGTATASVVGGTGTITYSWAPIGGNAIIATGLPAGVYTVTVTDANGCQSSATTSPPISQPPAITITVTTSNVHCFGGSNGSATASAIGGTPGYSYLWLPSNSTGTSISGLTAGTYTVRATDSHSCPQDQTFTITQPAVPLSVSANSTPATCFGGNTGTASSLASGGTAPYNYMWAPGNISGQNISNLTAGTYTINVSDIRGCPASNTAMVSQPTLLVLTPSSANSTCGNSNGQVTVGVSGGTPSYTYTWSPTGGNAPTANGLPSGNYTVTVSDNNSCIKATAITVNNTPGPVAGISSISNVSCNGGADGTATVTVTGGTGTMDYLWAPVGGIAATGTGLTTGTYTVTVTDDNGCQTQAITGMISEPPAISVNVNVSDASCFAGSNGSASAAASGGTPGYTYLWLPSNSSGSTISGLAAGTYTVRATDTKNCIHDQSFTVSQPATAVSVSLSSSAVLCFGGNSGSASATASGGVGPYTYIWSPGSQGGTTISNIATGVYTVNVTDDHGCPTTGTVNVTQPSQTLSATSNGDPAACFGGSDGDASVVASGGTPNYSYQWLPTGGTAATASGLASGTYTVTVTDLNGCQTNSSVAIGQPTEVSGTLVPVNPSCGLANGIITSQVTGGTGPYTYLWTPGNMTTSSVNGLAPGTYSLQVTDAMNCVKSYSVTLTDIPGPVVNVSSTTNTSCFGGGDGTATVTISSGTAPFTTVWQPSGGNNTTASNLPAGTYTVNVTDQLGCPGSATLTVGQPDAVTVSVSSLSDALCNVGATGTATIAASGGTPNYTYLWAAPVNSTSASVSNLAAGTYTVTATDQHSCSHAISIIIDQPPVLSSTMATVTNPICYNGGGSATVIANGGTVPYSYQWSITPVQNGNELSNAPNGTYTVTITDANGCTNTNTVSITQPLPVVTTAGPNDTICLGTSGTITASATGGAGNYYFAWQPGGAINTGTLNVSPTSQTEYVVIAYDQSGCAGNPDTVEVIVYSLAPANIQVYGNTPICPGQSSTVYALTTGSTGPLTYSWNNGLGTGPGAFLVTPFQPTTYVLTVSSSCATWVVDSVAVSFNPQPTLQLLADTNKICVPGSVQFSDASITGNVNDPITSWLWTFGDGTTSTNQNPAHTFNSPGTYNVSLSVSTDGGCTSNNASSPYTIYGYPYPNAGFTINDNHLDLPSEHLVCSNLSTGAVSYNWDFGDGNTSSATNPQHAYNSVGLFDVTLTAVNQYGCADTYTLGLETDASVIFPNAFTPNPVGPNGGAYSYGTLTNDVFFPYTSGVTEYKLQVFNRWGELIFESLDIKTGWDGYYRGKLCQQDVYIWKAYLKLNNGKTFNKTGDVTLLQ